MPTITKEGYLKFTVYSDGTSKTEIITIPAAVDTTQFATKTDLDAVKASLAVSNTLKFSSNFATSLVSDNSYTIDLSSALLNKLTSLESRIKTLETGVVTPPPSTVLSLTNAIVVADGNSLTAGGETIPYTEWLKQKDPFTTNGAKIYNFAVGGQSTIDMINDAATQIDPLFNPALTNILVAYEIGNDIYHNGNAANAVAAFKGYCLDRKAKGWKVFVVTCTPRDQVAANGDTSAVFNQKLVQANNLLKSTYTTFADGLIDLAAEPKLQNTANPTYYVADKVHYTNEGHKVFADLVYTTLMNYTGTPIPIVAPPTGSKPNPPIVDADDSTNNLYAHSPLGGTEVIELSVNGGAWGGYAGAGNVGNINLPKGYFKFRVKSINGNPASDSVDSPAFTAK